MRKKLYYYFKYGLAVLILLVVGLLGFNNKISIRAANNTTDGIVYLDQPNYDGWLNQGWNTDYQNSDYTFGTRFKLDNQGLDLRGLGEGVNVRFKVSSYDQFGPYGGTANGELFFDIKNFATARTVVKYDVMFSGFKWATVETTANLGEYFITIFSDQLGSTYGMTIDISTQDLEDTTEPVIVGETYVYITSVDNPTTIANMRTQIKLSAYDDIDGDLTSAIVLVNDGGYATEVLNKTDVKTRTLGDYGINFSVTDSSDNTATVTITIRVVDTTKPVISGSSTFTYNTGYGSAPLSTTTILNGITATDNYSAVTKSIAVDNYTANANKVGSYTIIVKATDTAGNFVTATVTIVVYDNVKPVITGSTTFYKSYDVVKSSTDIINISNIVATDSIDGSMTLANGKLKIQNDTYTGKSNIPGSYSIVVRATDTKGNFTDFTISVTVGDDVIPYFLLNKNKVIIESGVNFTATMLISTLKDVGVIQNKSLSMTVINDTYTGNESVAGLYNYDMKVLYTDGYEEIVNLEVEVLAAENDGSIEIPIEEKTFWEKLAQPFVWLWNHVLWPIIKFFLSIFTFIWRIFIKPIWNFIF